jgi:hypothetical protein
MLRPMGGGPGIGGFDLEGELGRGAMGVVYRARQRSTGREVALKVMATRVARDAGQRERFRREGEIMAGLRHPGVLAIHAAGLEGDTAWLACELVEGARTLDEAADGQPLRRKVELVRDVARALGHAHRAGVVHRDVKPANVLVDAAGRVRVADFGMALSEELERLTQTGHAVGTPAYMSPEQMVGERAQIGPRSDVWAAGVMLYELLTGRLPFQAGSIQALIHAVALGEVDPPSAHAPDVPAPLDAIVLASLASHPEGRQVDGDALADELDAWLAGGDPRGGRPVRRARRRAALALGALVCGAAPLVVLVRGVVERRGAAAALDDAGAWDGAALAAWALGAGHGPPPDRADLAERAGSLAALEARLAEPADRARAAELRLRLVAHERLLGVARPAGTTPTDLLVTAALAADDERAPPELVVAAIASAAAADGVPGAVPLLARALARALERRAPTPDTVAGLLASAPPALRAALVEPVRPWVTREALAAREGLAAGRLDSLLALGPLLDLAGAVNAAPPPALVVGPPPRPEEEEPDFAAPVPVEAPRLWSEVLRALKVRPADEVVAAITSAIERVGRGSAAPLLRALRQASSGDLERKGADALLALRFDAEACRVDPRGSRALSREPVERALRELAADAGPGGAEALAALSRLALASPVPVWPGKLQEEPLRRLAAARPWSRSARAARLPAPGKGEPGPELLEVVAAPTDDLSDGAHEGLVRRLGLAAMEAAAQRASAGEVAPLTAAAWAEACRRPLPAARLGAETGALVAALGALVAEGRVRRPLEVPPLHLAPPPWLEDARAWRLARAQALVAMGRRLASRDDAGAARLLGAGVARLLAEEAGVERLDAYEDTEFADVLLAQCLYRLEDYEGVLATLERPRTLPWRRRSASLVATVTVALIQLNRHEEALALIDEVTAHWRTQDQADPQTIEVLRSLERSRGRVRVNPKR